MSGSGQVDPEAIVSDFITELGKTISIQSSPQPVLVHPMHGWWAKVPSYVTEHDVRIVRAHRNFIW